MKVYVVITDISYDFNNSIDVELFKNRKDAEKYMQEQFKWEINDTKYDTIEREIDILSAYNEGYFTEKHCEIRLVEREVNIYEK